jgi:agmatine/peptidylarginine deiminase
MSKKSLIAEWEEQSFIQFAMPHKNSDWKPYLKDAIKTFSIIINRITKTQKVIVLYSNRKDLKYLKNNSNLILKKMATNDTWCRDFGAISIKNGDDIQLLDFGFNGWGLKYSSNFDNKTTKQIGFKNQICTKNLILEGGSIDFNGVDTLLTTSACLLESNRNPQYSKNKIEHILKYELGIKNIIWLNRGFLEGDDTDSHIDMLARFVSNDTIVYQSCDDKRDIHYKELKLMEKELKKTNFKLIKLPWIKPIYFDKERLPASYANFLITNKNVIVPLYRDKNDKKALKIFNRIFPTRKVIGVDATTLIKQHGSIHCITMNYPKGVKLK